jgi:hypothetical protein
VVDDLSKYIEEQLKKGYAPDLIRATLRTYGYPEATIKAAFPKSHKLFIFIALFAIIGSISAFMFYSFLTAVPEDEDFRVRTIPAEAEEFEAALLPQQTVRAGRPLEFSAEISPYPPSSLKTKYEILDAEGKIVHSQDAQFSTFGSLELPELAVGDYELRGTYTFSGKKITAAAAFRVTSQSFTVRSEDITEDKPNEKDRVAQIISLAESEPSQALSLCGEVRDKVLSDQCHLEAGLTVHDQVFCRPIKSNDVRDTCYFNLALVAQNNLLCQDITDKHLKSTCAQI